MFRSNEHIIKLIYFIQNIYSFVLSIKFYKTSKTIGFNLLCFFFLRNDATMDNVYKSLARYLNCEPKNIAIVGSATSAWTQVFFGFKFQPGDVILTTVSEYGSNFINFLQVYLVS